MRRRALELIMVGLTVAWWSASSTAPEPTVASPIGWVGVTPRQADRHEPIETTTTTVPVTLPPALSTKRSERSAHYDPSLSPWDRIAECESGGDWSINTGNGYYGGLQENMSFWNSYGPRVTVTHEDGTQTEELVAARPDLASREDQIAAAEAARDSGRGYAPWPVCGRLA